MKGTGRAPSPKQGSIIRGGPTLLIANSGADADRRRRSLRLSVGLLRPRSDVGVGALDRVTRHSRLRRSAAPDLLSQCREHQDPAVDAPSFARNPGPRDPPLTPALSFKMVLRGLSLCDESERGLQSCNWRHAGSCAPRDRDLPSWQRGHDARRRCDDRVCPIAGVHRVGNQSRLAICLVVQAKRARWLPMADTCRMEPVGRSASTVEISLLELPGRSIAAFVVDDPDRCGGQAAARVVLDRVEQVTSSA